jgi:hypothetical protein
MLLQLRKRYGYFHTSSQLIHETIKTAIFRLTFKNTSVFVEGMDLPKLFISLKEPGLRKAENSDLPVVGVEPLVIDGIEFSLLNRWTIVKTTHTHDCVTFQSFSKGRKQRFGAYKSNSYCFWRLLILYDSNKKFYKGSVDYIQQTFLHLDLQKYINANYEKLEQVDDEYKKYSDPHYPVLPEEYNDHPFIPEINATQFTAFEKAQDLYHKSVIEAIDDPARIVEIEPFYSYMRQEANGCGVRSSVRDSNLAALSEEIRFMHGVNGKPELVYKDYEHSDSEHVLRSNIYRVNLGEHVHFYFMIFSFDSIGAFNVHKKNQFAPVFMTTNTHIVDCGIYANYVPAGNFICKIMDYDWQCLESDVQCTEAYAYIGDMYQGLYPFTDSALQRLLTKGGGGRRRSRRRLRGGRRSLRKGLR